jgi:hypothetical protein
VPALVLSCPARAWTTSTMTAEEWIAEASSEVDPILYTELVDDWTAHVDVGHLAFARADAVLRIDGRPERHNIDDFTLIEHDGVWKFLTLSYLGRPAPTPGTFSGAPASGSSIRR